jgi:hypothetical protein
VAFPNGHDTRRVSMSYAIGGKQFVAIAAGNTIYSFALP